MGFRYYRRINLGNGFGLNVSKSGISPSIRTRWGAFGAKGFSIRTGLPGLSYRKAYSRTKQNDGMEIFFFILLLLSVLYLAILIIWNLGRLVVWSVARLHHVLKPKPNELPGQVTSQEAVSSIQDNTNMPQ
ncbi:MAG: DUF4236 domain-containing protein [Bacteroidales bacterium]|nr:DUF4236 domain-containing protein [Bacteroidales bacterium]